MMHLTAYAIPAVLALLAKALMFFYARNSKIHNLQTRLYLLFLFSLAIQNLTEIAGFSAKAEGLATPPSGTVYFSASIFAVALFLHLALVLAVNWRESKSNLPLHGLILLYTPVIVLQALLWGGPLLLVGFQPMGYTYTKIPGPLYFLFELYAAGYLCVTVALFAYGAYTQSTAFRRLQNKLLLVGLLPATVLVVAVISAQRFGFHWFNATVTLPLAVTFFLAVTAYATHQHRLFDIEFFIPWSKVRKRKTEFYKRIQALMGEIARMKTITRVVQSLSEALNCPVALIGGTKPVYAIAGEAFGVARFPLDELKKIDSIVVANEIAEARPSTRALMKRHKVAAIVPFHPYSRTAASWVLLGEKFSDEVYSPLDFKVVENLFARLADHFLDAQLLLRDQLADAHETVQTLQASLTVAWDQLDAERRKTRELSDEVRRLREKLSGLIHLDLAIVESDVYDVAARERKTLEERLAQVEAKLIARVLKQCDGDRARAAEELGVAPLELYRKMRDYALIPEPQA